MKEVVNNLQVANASNGSASALPSAKWSNETRCNIISQVAECPEVEPVLAPPKMRMRATTPSAEKHQPNCCGFP